MLSNKNERWRIHCFFLFHSRLDEWCFVHFFLSCAFIWLADFPKKKNLLFFFRNKIYLSWILPSCFLFNHRFNDWIAHLTTNKSTFLLLICDKNNSIISSNPLIKRTSYGRIYYSILDNITKYYSLRSKKVLEFCRIFFSL